MEESSADQSYGIIWYFPADRDGSDDSGGVWGLNQEAGLRSTTHLP